MTNTIEYMSENPGTQFSLNKNNNAKRCGYGGSRVFFQVPEIVDSVTPPLIIAKHRIWLWFGYDGQGVDPP